MSIKLKTSLIIIISAVLLITMVYITSQTLLIGSVLTQERDITRNYLERINNALEYKGRSLHSTMNDWADWDDTYYFAQGVNGAYEGSNLTDGTLLNLRLNIVAVIDTKGRLVYGTMIDPDSKKRSGLSNSFLEHLEGDNPITGDQGKNKITSGFLALPEGMLLITSKDIQKSDESGPAAGTLVFGRFIDDDDINEINEITGIDFSIGSINSIQLPPGFEASEQTLTNGEKYYVQPIDENHISGYCTINDIYGKNGFFIKVDSDRRFYQKAKQATNFFIAALILCGFAILGASIFILQKTVSSRLLLLNRFVTQIRSKQDTSLRVNISGKDEITNLAEEMNRMLEELNRTQEDNQRLVKEVMGYDELKNEFFSNISHEFRTPINVLLSTLQLINLQHQDIETDANAVRITKYINIMKQNCYRLLRLASNLIDITKMDSGFFEINPVKCNVVEVIEDITMSVAEYIQGKGIKLEFDTDVEEKVMSADPEKIERIMLNLLSNAVKFTEDQGSVFVNIKDKGESIEVSVKDTGIGIPEDKLDIVFERFRQVNSSLTRSHEGSGIGLSLVKNLVELHGGTIRVESEYGKGAEFIFELPAKVGIEDVEQGPAPLTSQGREDMVNIEFSDTYSK